MSTSKRKYLRNCGVESSEEMQHEAAKGENKRIMLREERP